MINLSRNTPVVFVVGAAGFLGSHLVDDLLGKGIQVVGVDDLSDGSLENLKESVRNKNFHFLNQSSLQPISIELPRLDYAVFTVSETLPEPAYLKSLENFLYICSPFNPKIILLSSIELYDHEARGLQNLREGEKMLAKYAGENNANARVVRLAAVYGPRMHFREDDPVVDLLESALCGKLHKEAGALDFSTRGMFVDDAVNLLTKALFHGSTAQKIYDGALPSPIKVSEVSQVLLDPLWYEARGFIPTELPPWPTPNLLKTQKELSWKPKTPLVSALKMTLHEMKNRGFVVKKDLSERGAEEKNENTSKEVFPRPTLKSEEKKAETGGLPKPGSGLLLQKKIKISPGFKKRLEVIIAAALIFYALIYPLGTAVFDVLTVRSALGDAQRALKSGDFDAANKSAQAAKEKAAALSSFFSFSSMFIKAGVFQNQLQDLNQSVYILSETADGLSFAALGMNDLKDALRSISGERAENSQSDDLGQIMEKTLAELDGSDRKLSYAEAALSDPGLSRVLAGQAKGWLKEVKVGVSDLRKMVDESKLTTEMLYKIVALNGTKEYVVFLEDNNQLRPGGGLPLSYADVVFEKGRLKTITAGDVSSLDKKFTERVDPPAEIRKDLGKMSWSLVDANFEPDFPSSARWLQWFYTKESGTRVDGVISLDLTAASKMAEVMGPLKLAPYPSGTGLADSGQTVDAAFLANPDNISTRPALAAAILKEILNKLFFLPDRNWSGLAQALDQSLSEKHLLVYFSDPALFSYLNTSGWSGAVPRGEKVQEGGGRDFLALSEANIGGNEANFYLKRAVFLQTTIDSANLASHKLTVSYLSSAPSGGNVYKGRAHIYLSLGSKLTKASWGVQDILSSIGSLSDYGRAGYSLSLALSPGEQKDLVLEYQDLKPLSIGSSGLKYRLDVVKQPGTDSDRFDYKLNLPDNLKAQSSVDGTILQQVSFLSDLSKDRSFEVVLNKK